MLSNKTTGKKIMQKVLHADTHWLRLKGLMFEDQRRFDYALVFTLPRQSIANATIHMLFVFFPIDVVYLDNEKKVVDIVRKLQPFSPYYAPRRPAKFFVELPVGKSLGVKLGDRLEW
ncbi:MAG: DUF192 domain-containing protein [Candidatus Diapherotrites archaeon]|nr:DUF192 domain-containing protein [Candidatus Diapherotrites archaeon]